jgi:hypothetical protein
MLKMLRSYLLFSFAAFVLPWSTFAATAIYGVGEAPQTVTAGDLNGDGFPELVTANLADGTLSILFNNGDGTFKEPFTPIGVGPVRDVAIADMTNDGIPDIVTETENVDGAILVFPGLGDGTFFSAIETSFGVHNITSIGVTDLNDDGNQDVIVGFRDEGVVRVFIGNGNGTFGPAIVDSPENFPGILDVPTSISADLNLDEITDTATVNAGTNSVTVVLGGLHPTSKEQCKNDGYRLYVDDNNAPFKNQGQCIQYMHQ